MRRMATNDEILAALDAGLLEAITAQEYQLPNGRRVRRAEVDKLIAARNELKSQMSVEDDGVLMDERPVSFGRIQ